MSSVKLKGDPKYYEAGGKPFPNEEVEFILIGAGASLTFKFTIFFGFGGAGARPDFLSQSLPDYIIYLSLPLYPL